MSSQDLTGAAAAGRDRRLGVRSEVVGSLLRAGYLIDAHRRLEEGSLP